MSKTFSGVPGDSKCECSDPGCKSGTEHGSSPCGHIAVTILYRIDMQDETGTAFCEACADDAFDSGLFTDQSIDDQLLAEDIELDNI